MQPKHHAAISNTDEKHSYLFNNAKQSTGGSSGLTALASTKKGVDESASKMRYKEDLPKKMVTDELESDKQSSSQA